MNRVLFRVWRKTGDVIAILPDVPANYGCVMMYEHIGQHGEGHYRAVLERARPAQPKEYASLLQELQSIGYDDLVIRKRLSKEVTQ